MTTNNTVVIPVKTTATGGYRVEGRNGATGALVWSAATDYVMPPRNWLPPYNLLLTPQGRLYAPGAGGKLLVRADADAATGTFAPQVFYGAAAYNANPAAFDGSVFINTPLTADAQGNVFFGFHVTGANPAGLVERHRARRARRHRHLGRRRRGGRRPCDPEAGDELRAGALERRQHGLHRGEHRARRPASRSAAILLALDSTTLATRARVALIDPNLGTPARISDDGTAAPVVGPDGRVFYGVLEAQFPTHNARGWLLQFDALLNPVGVPGSFGWDVSPSVIPASMVPSYAGTSTYLLAQKYNNYRGVGTGDGLNRLAVLDPRASQADPIVPGVQVMREVLTILGPTLDGGSTTARREWCINTMAADPRAQLDPRQQRGRHAVPLGPRHQHAVAEPAAQRPASARPIRRRWSAPTAGSTRSATRPCTRSAPVRRLTDGTDR